MFFASPRVACWSTLKKGARGRERFPTRDAQNWDGQHVAASGRALFVFPTPGKNPFARRPLRENMPIGGSAAGWVRSPWVGGLPPCLAGLWPSLVWRFTLLADWVDSLPLTTLLLGQQLAWRRFLDALCCPGRVDA